MKRILVFVFIMALACSFSLTAAAKEASYDTAGDLYEAWQGNLPDYICGVWSTDGGEYNLTFGIQNSELGNAGKEEILCLVNNDSTLTFVYQVYSRNYLLRIQREIDEYLQKDVGLISTALDDRNNRIVLGILEEREDEDETATMMADIVAAYGDAVTFVYDDYAYITSGHPLFSDIQQLLFFIVAISCVALIGSAFLLGRKKRSLIQTTVGETITERFVPSVKEIEDMIRKADCDVPLALEHKIMCEINKIV